MQGHADNEIEDKCRTLRKEATEHSDELLQRRLLFHASPWVQTVTTLMLIYRRPWKVPKNTANIRML